MNYLSVCSGIEAATVAWHDLGWNPVGFSEIEKFPSQVLKHHYPEVPNLGDMTKFKEWKIGTDVNLLVGGTPCQSFSVAGLRKGLDDPRGNLMLTYLAIADKYRPKWLVWENVPGVLSSNNGKDFGTFLGGLGELGYGFAYRVLDAQYFGVAQRRRRVFVVGYLGDWRPAAAVLFERESLCGNPPPSRKARQATAPGSSSSLDVSCTGTITAGFGKLKAPEIDAYTAIPVAQPAYDPSPTITSRMQGSSGWAPYNEDAHLLMSSPISFSAQMSVPQTDVDLMQTLLAKNPMAVAQPVAFQQTADCLTSAYGTKWNGNASATNGSLFAGQPEPVAMRESGQVYWMQDEIAGTLRAEGEDRPSRPSHVIGQPVATDLYNGAVDGDVAHSLRVGNGNAMGGVPSVMEPVAVTSKGDGSAYEADVTNSLCGSGGGQAGQGYMAARVGMQVRRLTPVECERLQGFPDNYTNIGKNGKETPDGP